MKVKDLREILSHHHGDNEVVFYNLENYHLESARVESILDADSQCEITTTTEKE